MSLAWGQTCLPSAEATALRPVATGEKTGNEPFQKQIKILIICDHNRERSPLVAALLRANIPAGLAGRLIITSAGIYETPRDNYLQQYIEKDPILRLHTPHVVTPEELREADIIFVMTKSQKEKIEKEHPYARGKVFLICEGEDLNTGIGDYPSPEQLYLPSAQTYRSLREKIEGNLDRIFKRIQDINLKSAIPESAAEQPLLLSAKEIVRIIDSLCEEFRKRFPDSGTYADVLFSLLPEGEDVAYFSAQQYGVAEEHADLLVLHTTGIVSGNELVRGDLMGRIDDESRHSYIVLKPPRSNSRVYCRIKGIASQEMAIRYAANDLILAAKLLINGGVPASKRLMLEKDPGLARIIFSKFGDSLEYFDTLGKLASLRLFDPVPGIPRIRPSATDAAEHSVLRPMAAGERGAPRSKIIYGLVKPNRSVVSAKVQGSAHTAVINTGTVCVLTGDRSIGMAYINPGTTLDILDEEWRVNKRDLTPKEAKEILLEEVFRGMFPALANERWNKVLILSRANAEKIFAQRKEKALARYMQYKKSKGAKSCSIEELMADYIVTAQDIKDFLGRRLRADGKKIDMRDGEYDCGLSAGAVILRSDDIAEYRPRFIDYLQNRSSAADYFDLTGSNFDSPCRSLPARLVKPDESLSAPLSGQAIEEDRGVKEAQVLIAQKRFYEARTILHKILRRGSNPAASRLLGEVNILVEKVVSCNNQANRLFEEKRYTEAKELLLDVLNLYPEDQYTLANLARMCCMTGNNDEAIDYADKALGIEPEGIHARITKAKALIGRRGPGDLDSAIMLCNEVSRREPNNIGSRITKVQALIARGNPDDYRQAEEILNAVELQEEGPSPETKRLRDKLAAARAGLDIREKAASYNKEANRLIAKGKLIGAKKLLLEALTVYPENEYILGNLARICHMMGYNIEAINYVDRALKIDPENIPVRLTKAQALIACHGPGDIDLAITLCHEVLERQPDNIPARIRETQALMARGAEGDYQKAENILKMVETLQGPHPPVTRLLYKVRRLMAEADGGVVSYVVGKEAAMLSAKGPEMGGKENTEGTKKTEKKKKKEGMRKEAPKISIKIAALDNLPTVDIRADVDNLRRGAVKAKGLPHDVLEYLARYGVAPQALKARLANKSERALVSEPVRAELMEFAREALPGRIRREMSHPIFDRKNPCVSGRTNKALHQFFEKGVERGLDWMQIGGIVTTYLPQGFSSEGEALEGLSALAAALDELFKSSQGSQAATPAELAPPESSAAASSVLRPVAAGDRLILKDRPSSPLRKGLKVRKGDRLQLETANGTRG